MADLNGKTVLVTGATNGIGFTAARALARMGATVLVHGRSAEKGKRAVAEIAQAAGHKDVHYVHADFAALEDVRRLAAEVNALDRLDILINNAGGINLKRALTADGYERTFAVNHLAPFLLTNLTLDTVKRAPRARIVNVASNAHRGAQIDFGDLMCEKRYAPMTAYGRSKLANILFTRALARRLEGTGATANSLHPGVVHTGIAQNGNPFLKLVVAIVAPFAMISPEEGAKTTVHLATAPELEGRSGGYYEKSALAKPTAEAEDDAAAERLWQESARLVGLA